MITPPGLVGAFHIIRAVEPDVDAVINRGAEEIEAVALEVKVKVLFKIPGTVEPTLSVAVLVTPAGSPLTMTVGVSDEDVETVVYPVMP